MSVSTWKGRMPFYTANQSAITHYSASYGQENLDLEVAWNELRRKEAGDVIHAIEGDTWRQINKDKSRGIGAQNDGEIISAALGFPEKVKMPQLVDIKSLARNSRLVFLQFKHRAEQERNRKQPVSIPEKVLLRLSREYIERYMAGESLELITNSTHQAAVWVAEALSGQHHIVDRQADVVKMIKVAIILQELDIVMLNARVMAYLRWYFIEQKNSPTDRLLTCVWNNTNAGHTIRKLLVASALRKLLFDNPRDLKSVISKFETLFPGKTFTDVRPNTWFYDFHIMFIHTISEHDAVEQLATCVHRLYHGMIRFQTRAVSGLEEYLSLARQLGVVREDSAALPYPLIGLETQNNRKTRKQLLLSLENKQIDAIVEFEDYDMQFDLPEPDFGVDSEDESDEARYISPSMR